MGILSRQGGILLTRACAIYRPQWKAFLNLSEACTSVEKSPETLGNAAWCRAQGLPREGWGIHSLSFSMGGCGTLAEKPSRLVTY